MRSRVSLLAALAAIGVAGSALAATNNTYLLSGSVTPKKSGTPAREQPIALGYGYLAGTSPFGLRPAPVSNLRFSFQGITEHTTFFPACDTSVLTVLGPARCPRGSLIGIGYQINELGPSGNRDNSYQTRCRTEEDMFNGGSQNFVLYLYMGKGHRPGPCPLPDGHVEINVNLAHSSNGLTLQYSVPDAVRHPSLGQTQATIYDTMSIVREQTRRGHIGLLATYSCQPNHQRQFATTFTEEGTNVSRTTTRLLPCS